MKTGFIHTGTISFILLCSFTKLVGQACPACSNPALQSSEKLEAGLDTLKKGTLRTTLNVVNGFNYQGGHPNWKGLSLEGSVIDAPLHNHLVDLDFVRSELSLEFSFNTNWSVWLRVPYDFKMQTATVEFIEPASQYERDAILRNRDIHHRTENYQGFSDLRLMFARRFLGIFSPKGRLDLAFGTSIPIGKTEEDPLKAGEGGLEHLHIQFGTGTFDPLLELHYATGLTGKLSLAVFSINKISLYQNNKMYRGPFETTSGFSFGYEATETVIPRLTLASFSQSRAKWNGANDPNSGLISYNLTAHLTMKFKNGLTVTPGYRHPVGQHTLSEDGDTFAYGSTFLLNVSFKP